MTELTRIERLNAMLDEMRAQKQAEQAQTYADLEDGELRRHEGQVTNAEGMHKSYNDTEGFLTGGIGHLMSSEEKGQYPLGSVIPDEQVENWFNNDKKQAQQNLDRILKEKRLEDLPVEAKRVLFNMTFNLGESGIRGFNRMWSALGRNDFGGAAAEMKDSLWYGQVKTRGEDLVNRMTALADMNKDLPGVKFAGRPSTQEREQNNEGTTE